MDNQTRKVIVLFKKILIDFINPKIKNVDDNLNKIRKIFHKENEDFKVNNVKELLNKQLKDIFCNILNNKYNDSKKNYNKLLINNLEKSQNEEINNILGYTFLDCLKYFRKDEEALSDPNFAYLKGLDKFFEYFLKIREERIIKEKHDEDNIKHEDINYIDDIIKLIKNIEKIYEKIKSRASRKKKIVKIN